MPSEGAVLNDLGPDRWQLDDMVPPDGFRGSYARQRMAAVLVRRRTVFDDVIHALGGQHGAVVPQVPLLAAAPLAAALLRL
jgi:hypothetical protein